MDPYLGQLALAGFNFPPKGWAFCQGQLLSIAQNTALFSLLGTYYGGDGRTTFGLPNLQGMVPIGAGQGPGLTQRNLGETGGEIAVTLLQSEIPVHTHTINSQSGRGTPVTEPAGNAPAQGSVTPYAPATSSKDQKMSPAMMSPAGGSQPHNNMAPFVSLNWIIALQGIFPQRS
jgi:microcystin-dependent protein